MTSTQEMLYYNQLFDYAEDIVLSSQNKHLHIHNDNYKFIEFYLDDTFINCVYINYDIYKQFRAVYTRAKYVEIENIVDTIRTVLKYCQK